ncbi:MAG: FHA domain-containing protein [Lachnospiraceae bacterium]|nr:FHA domain-containing protein [Lachnospiraceae bacterium]
MDIRFRNDINHNYMIIRKEEEASGFQEKMVLKNSIPGLMRVSLQSLNGESYYSYDVKEMQQITKFFDGREIKGAELKKILCALSDLLSELDRYLLSGKDLMMNPECILWDSTEGTPVFAYYPNNKALAEESFMSFAEFLIDKVDKNDPEATSLAYDYFNRIGDGEYSPKKVVAVISETDSQHKKDHTGNRSEDKKTDNKIDNPDIDILERDAGLEDLESEDLTNADIPLDPGTSKKLMGLLMLLMVISGLALGALIWRKELLSALGIDMDYYLGFCVGSAAVLISSLLGLGALKLGQRKKDSEGATADDSEREKWDLEAFKSKAFTSGNIRKSEPQIDTFERDAPTEVLNESGVSMIKPTLSGVAGGENAVLKIDHTPYMIGKMRGKADGIIMDSCVSRVHACIRQNAGRFFISDLNSTNGTYINERRLERNETAEICDGDILKFAEVEMRFAM